MKRAARHGITRRRASAGASGSRQFRAWRDAWVWL